MSNDTSTTENLRDRILPAHLFTYKTPSGETIFTGPITTRAYYDKMIAAGDTPEDIIETISIHRDNGVFKLSQLTKQL